MTRNSPWRRASLRAATKPVQPRKPRRPGHGPNPTTELGKRRVAAGFRTQEALGAVIGIAGKTIQKLELGECAPNHPYLPRIAEALHMPVEELRMYATLPPMIERQVKRIITRFGNGGEPPAATAPDDATPEASANGTVMSTALMLREATSRNGRMTPARYNKLKRLDDKTRQLARGLASAVNVARMQGTRYVTVNVPLPTDALAALLTDYFNLKGIKPRVLIEADFSEVFA